MKITKYFRSLTVFIPLILFVCSCDFFEKGIIPVEEKPTLLYEESSNLTLSAYFRNEIANGRSIRIVASTAASYSTGSLKHACQTKEGKYEDVLRAQPFKDESYRADGKLVRKITLYTGEFSVFITREQLKEINGTSGRHVFLTSGTQFFEDCRGENPWVLRINKISQADSEISALLK